MRRIPEEKMYKGNIYKCVSSWSVAGSYFGVPYKEELVCEGKTFVLLKDGSYAELGDLKNNGRKAIRYKAIKVKYQDIKLKEHVETFMGWTAQIIQHEIDHCNGTLI